MLKAHEALLRDVPELYLTVVRGDGQSPSPSLEDDANCLARIRHYRSLMPLAQAAHKPMFQLTPADGAVGSLAHAVRASERDVAALATRIAERCGLTRGHEDA